MCSDLAEKTASDTSLLSALIKQCGVRAYERGKVDEYSCGEAVLFGPANTGPSRVMARQISSGAHGAHEYAVGAGAHHSRGKNNRIIRTDQHHAEHRVEPLCLGTHALAQDSVLAPSRDSVLEFDSVNTANNKHVCERTTNRYGADKDQCCGKRMRPAKDDSDDDRCDY